MQFFNYVMRKVWLHQTRIGLSLYDVAGQGYLKESVSFFPSLIQFKTYLIVIYNDFHCIRPLQFLPDLQFLNISF